MQSTIIRSGRVSHFGRQKKAFGWCLASSIMLLCITALGQETIQGKLNDVIRIDTGLVVVRATVVDKKGHAVVGLKKPDFRLVEDNVEQTIALFSSDPSPVSWGLVLDRSGSMEGMMTDVSRAALHVIDNGTTDDEMFILSFNETTDLLTPFERDRHRLENAIAGLRADGNTAVYDAVNFALEQFKGAKYRKKVLIVITDGEDNASKVKLRSLIERAEEDEVIIYSVGMVGTGYMAMRSRSGFRDELEKLASVTGGSAHFPDSIKECQRVMSVISLEVKDQYSLAYYPSNNSYDGRWRSIKVTRVPDTPRDHLIRTRKGYYAKAKNANH